MATPTEPRSAFGPNAGEARAPVVFVVDDEAPNRILMERAMRGQGYDLRIFSDGVEALEAIEQGAQPDVLISDIVMPRLNG